MDKENLINEGKVLKDLPGTLIFRKKGVQQFPNNQRVALYYCEDLKKYFSIAYNKNGMELMESEYSTIEKLKEIDEVRAIIFNDGSTININKECVDSILELYENLEEGKEEFVDFLEESNSNFLKLLDYSTNKFKKEI